MESSIYTSGKLTKKIISQPDFKVFPKPARQEYIEVEPKCSSSCNRCRRRQTHSINTRLAVE